MTSDEVKEAFAVADRVIARVGNGVPRGREVNADEIMPIIRALYTYKAMAFAGAEYIHDNEASHAESRSK